MSFLYCLVRLPMVAVGGLAAWVRGEGEVPEGEGVKKPGRLKGK